MAMIRGTLVVVAVLVGLLLAPAASHAYAPSCCVCIGCPTAVGSSTTVCQNSAPLDTLPDAGDPEFTQTPCACPAGCTTSKRETGACALHAAECDPNVGAPALSWAVLAGLAGLLAGGGIYGAQRRTS